MERIPILQLGSCLLITIQTDLDDQLALTLQEELAQTISARGARGVLIDIYALDLVDSFIGRVLGNIASVAHVMDARTVVVGMQPAVAITLVELGVTWRHVRTALNVDQGMALLTTARPSAAPEELRRHRGR